MTFQAIEKELNQRIFKPIYFLAGDEPLFIDRVVDFLEHQILDDAEKSFNQPILYGRDTNMPTVISEAKRYPMMAPFQVVIVKEAQHLKITDHLAAYAENPQMTTILAFAFKGKKLDKRTKAYKAINSGHVYLETKKIYDSQIPQWIAHEIRRGGYTISPKATELLAEHVGNDLSRLLNEMQKLFQIVDKSAGITADEIERNIGISKDYNNFELIKAIVKKDVLKANTILKYFSKDQTHHPVVLTVGLLYAYFSKLLVYHSLKDKSPRNVQSTLSISSYALRDYEAGLRRYPPGKAAKIISYLREADVRSKGVDNAHTSHYDIMRELIFKILH